MDINLDEKNEITRAKYEEFKEEVDKLIEVYKKDKRFADVKEAMSQDGLNWNGKFNFIYNDSNKNKEIDMAQILAYEYCLATEMITNKKISFDTMLKRVFSEVQRFKIGNPEPGIDDVCLYGKSLNDESAIPVTTKLYNIVMHAGAQHLDYFKGGKPCGAVFIYEKRVIKDIARDENNNSVDLKTEGINFSDLSKEEQSLLTNLRQCFYHEFNHCSEKEVIDTEKEGSIKEIHDSVDGKKYRNYERINEYVTADNLGKISEDKYIISTEKDENGKSKKFFIKSNGEWRPLDEVRFGLKHGNLEKELKQEYCVSTGLTTVELDTIEGPKIHNIITEGFVENTARAQIKAIEEYLNTIKKGKFAVNDIDTDKYPEYVTMADKVITSRDKSLGKNGEGQTYADFLLHSSRIKKDLESREVIRDGKKVDGLHYISDYADKVQDKETRKKIFFKETDKVEFSKEQKACVINLVNKRIDNIDISSDEEEQLNKIIKYASDEVKNMNISVEERTKLNKLFDVDNPMSMVDELADIIKEEQKFFDGIPEKLGYIEKTKKNDGQQQSPLLESGVEATLSSERNESINRQNGIIKSELKEKTEMKDYQK